MRRWIAGTISWPLLVLTYRAWGRCWIDDDTCRTLATWIMRAAIWVAR